MLERPLQAMVPPTEHLPFSTEGSGGFHRRIEPHRVGRSPVLRRHRRATMTSMRRPTGSTGRKPNSVWIVQHDESPHNTVLGVFATADEADAYSDEVLVDYPNGVITTEFPIGYRYTDGTVRYSR